jgi:hypothetical protein
MPAREERGKPQTRIALIRDSELDKRVERAIEAGQSGAAASDQELPTNDPLLTDFEQRDDLLL